MLYNQFKFIYFWIFFLFIIFNNKLYCTENNKNLINENIFNQEDLLRQYEKKFEIELIILCKTKKYKNASLFEQKHIRIQFGNSFYYDNIHGKIPFDIGFIFLNHLHHKATIGTLYYIYKYGLYLLSFTSGIILYLIEKRI